MPKLYTKTGDDGTTSLYDNQRLTKSAMVFAVLGDLDELSCHIGLLTAHLASSPDIVWFLRQIQLHILDISSIVATPDISRNSKGTLTIPVLPSDLVSEIEREIDELDKQLPPLTEFLITGVAEVDAQANVCRAVARRAERSMIKSREYELECYRVGESDDCFVTTVPTSAYQYINRVSDYFFALGRYVCPKEITVRELRSGPLRK